MIMTFKDKTALKTRAPRYESCLTAPSHNALVG
jgi:hypothetical protein